MRVLLFFNLIAVVVLAGALGRVYNGTPLPWVAHEMTPVAAPVATAPVAVPPPLAPAAGLPPYVPQPNPAHLPARAPEPVAPVTTTSPAPLRILTEAAYPPFNYRGADGLLTGFDIDLARALCQRIKRDCRFVVHRWADLVPALERGEGDVIMASMLIPSPGREAASVGDGIIFTHRYYSTPGHFAARKNGAPVAASAAALAGKRVAVQAGSIHEAFLKDRFASTIIIDAPSLDEAEKSLAEGRADILFADRNALLRWLTSRDGASCCRLVGTDYADPAYFGSGAGIALKATDAALRDEFDAALQGSIDDGTYAAISLRYFGQNIR